MSLFDVLNHKTVAISILETINDICAICRNNLNEKCIICSNQIDNANIKCDSVLGTCGHAYHYHCIKSWIDLKNNNCPLDNKIWCYVNLIQNQSYNTSSNEGIAENKNDSEDNIELGVESFNMHLYNFEHK